MEKKIKIYSQNLINTKKDIIKHNNAFILPSGDFILAKGYTGCNPSHQLESSALRICKYLTDKNLKEEYINLNDNLHSLYYLRTMLVHYYGFSLFARVEHIKAFNDRSKFSDYSIIPNPKYYGKEATSEQLITLKKLFEINDDGTLLTSTYENTSDEIYQNVLKHKKHFNNWHREF